MDSISVEGFFNIISLASAALVAGVSIGFNLKNTTKSSKKKIAASADDETKLKLELLQDEVKQLEAKNATLEKALDLMKK